MLPAVDHVVLDALALAFAHQHRAVVRPLLEPLRHERHLHARELDRARFLADTRAAAAAHLEPEAAARARLEPEHLETPLLLARHLLDGAARVLLGAVRAECIARAQHRGIDRHERRWRLVVTKQPGEPVATAAQLAVVDGLRLADFTRL